MNTAKNNNFGKEKIRIAIIDSGIDIMKSDLSDYVKNSTGFLINSEGYIIECKHKEIRHIHGTAIALIIKHICNQVEFFSVNILNEKLTTDCRVLVHALYKVLEFNPQIIHLSLGTTRWRYRFILKKFVKKASAKGIFVVSAADNSGQKSYPAYLNSVIGVKARDLANYNDFLYQNGFFYAPFNLNEIKDAETLGNTSNCNGSSMSAAYITGHLANILLTINNENTEKVFDTMKSLKNNFL